MIHFGIIHLPRPERVSLLHRTVCSLVDAGAASVAIYRDYIGDGPVIMLRRALDDMVTRAMPGDLICVSDDDLTYHQEAVHRAFVQLSNKPGHACTLWTIEQNLAHELRDSSGWVPSPVNKWSWGGSVVLEVGWAILVAQEIPAVINEHPDLVRSPDGTLYEAIKRLGIPVWHHIPSLADHIGTEASTLGNDHSRGDTRGYRYDQWQQPQEPM